MEIHISFHACEMSVSFVSVNCHITQIFLWSFSDVGIEKKEIDEDNGEFLYPKFNLQKGCFCDIITLISYLFIFR